MATVNWLTMRTRPPTASLLDIHDAGSCVTTTSTTSCGSSSSSGLGGTGSDVSSSSCEYQSLPLPAPPPHVRIASRQDTIAPQCPPRLVRQSPFGQYSALSSSPSSLSSSSQSNAKPQMSVARVSVGNYSTYQNISNLYSTYAVPSQLNSNYITQPSSIHCITLELEKDEKGELGIFITGRRAADGTLGYVVAGLETGSPAHRLVNVALACKMYRHHHSDKHSLNHTLDIREQSNE